MTLTRSDLAARMAVAANITQGQAADALRAFEDTVTQSLVAGTPVKLTGFAKFDTTQRSARNGRNPRTGESIEIPAATVVKIVPGAGLKTAVKGS
ncbi:HU family DNA-binding protein [Demequina globuliformis]|uniref:HU family DNA-binding protein n=1 Tax=Demequina globuliformis TaxID=676202 RepID=UPI0007854C99|nr:HU family DNA-binding protein [Demequina globuliformis]